MRFGRYVCGRVFLVVCLLAGPSRPAAAQDYPSITVSGDHFNVDYGNGPQPKFLLFFSYFDALRAENLDADLTYIKHTLKFDGIRIFPNWWLYDESLCPTAGQDVLFSANGVVAGDHGDGVAATGPLQKLRDLIELARSKALIVDITFARETVPGGMLAPQYITAVTRTAALLRDYRNVIFDLQNERDLQGQDRTFQHLSTADVSKLRAAIANPVLGDSRRIVVASTTLDEAEALDDVLTLVGLAPSGASLHAVAHHDTRSSNWFSELSPIVTKLRTSHKPVYLQEPMPWSGGLNLCGQQEPIAREADSTASNFRDALKNARRTGAAAWTFHTRQTFKLHSAASSSPYRRTLQQIVAATPGQKVLLEGSGGQAGLKDVGDTQAWFTAPVTVDLTVTVGGSGRGTVTSSIGGINCGVGGTICQATLPRTPQTAVTLTAVPFSTEYRFTGWSGACTGTSTCTRQLDESHTVTATFGEAPTDTVVYHHLDAIGSVRALTDSQGGTITRFDYAPFGEELTSSTTSVLKYAGKERDAETGLDYFGGRYLQSGTASFTSVDPVLDTKAALLAPQRWNRYAYALNNPIRLVDPDGREVPVLMNGKFYGMGLDGMSAGTPEQRNKVFAAWVDIVLGTGVYGGPALRVLTSCALSPSCAIPVAAAIEATAPGAPNSFAFSTSQLSAAGQAYDRSGLTVVARAWSKHSASQRPGSMFPPLSGNAEHWNRVGQQMLDEILATPEASRLIESNKFGGVDIYSVVTGRGVRFDSKGAMIGFIELTRRKQ